MPGHHFTVDVEEYFQVSAFERHVQRDTWDSRESRLASGLVPLLDLLDRHGARGTFFVLGWLVGRADGLLREIVARGHEIASHGWEHRRVTELAPEQFRDSVRRSRQVLEDRLGVPVRGYRAPSFSITRGREWALEILVEEGYAYDSSLFPVVRPGYGYRGGRRDPHRLMTPAGALLEVPPATLSVWGATMPAAGGAYFRILPYALVRAALRESESRGASGTFYIHPWELDVEQPRLPVSRLSRLRHYSGLRRTAPRLERLLEEFSFRPAGTLLSEGFSV